MSASPSEDEGEDVERGSDNEGWTKGLDDDELLQITEEEALVSRALRAVMGYVDPVAVALAVQAVKLGESRLTNALAGVMTRKEAAECAAAIASGAKASSSSGSSSSSSSEDEDDGEACSPWGVNFVCADEEMLALSEWASPTSAEAWCSEETVRRIATVVALTFCPTPNAVKLEVYGSRRIGLALFDSDVDIRVARPKVFKLKDLARALDATDWATSMEHVAARVPLVKGVAKKCGGVAFDVSRKIDGARVSVDVSEYLEPYTRRYPRGFAAIVRFAKLLLRQHGSDEVFYGGLGSFRLSVMVAAFLERSCGASRDHLLLRFLEHYAYSHRYDTTLVVGPVVADMSTLEDPRVIQSIFAQAAQAIRAAKPLSAILDTRRLAKKRARSRDRAQACFLQDRQHAADRENNHNDHPAKKRQRVD